MGFFRSWEDVLKRRSESEAMEMRKSALVGELRNIQRISKEPREMDSIIDSILNERVEENKISEIERLVFQLEELARGGKSMEDVLNKIEKLLH